MSRLGGLPPGFLAISRRRSEPVAELNCLAEHLGTVDTTSFVHDRSIDAMFWDLEGDPSEGVVLCRGARWRDQILTRQQAGAMLLPPRRGELADVLPPFAAVIVRDGHVTVATDSIGYRHIYVVRDADWSAVSTSLSALAALRPVTIDEKAMAVQSLLGWQLGRRTLYSEVEKLLAGHTVTLHDGNAVVERYARQDVPENIDGSVAVGEAAAFLRGYTSALLDDHHDATLQLSGGQDSRILLSAIDPARRTGLSAMTLRVPGSEDAPIAAELSRREGLRHRVISMADLTDLHPAEAFQRCRSASRSISSMANPLATAALVVAESASPQNPRIGGLGGEVARGFYYVGTVLPWPVTRQFAGAIAKWRLFTNESVPEGVLTTEFSRWAREFTIAEVFAELQATGLPLWAATDEFYLFQRMQRWAGVTDSAACFERQTINPMLDRRFLDVARGWILARSKGRDSSGGCRSPSTNHWRRCLSRGGLPRRCSPNRARGSAWTRGSLAVRRGANKVRQRIHGTAKPAAGTTILGAKVLEHWRHHPDSLSALAGVGFVNQSWIEGALRGTFDPTPAAIAFLLNVATAVDDAASGTSVAGDTAP